MSEIYPTYTVKGQNGTDRLVYVPERPWPDPSRQHLHVAFGNDTFVVNFDDRGRPCDVQHEMSLQARQKIRSRRQTPRGQALPEEM